MSDVIARAVAAGIALGRKEGMAEARRGDEHKPKACAHFHADDPRREMWTGKWPGEDDCERLGSIVNGDPDFSDLNRLFTDCVWDADTQRWERKQ